MKMLVEMLDRQELKDVMKLFIKPGEIKLLESIDKNYNGSSFYIDEQIEDINGLIEKLESYNCYSRQGKKDNIDQGTLEMFLWLVYEIYKFRLMGRDTSDVEFVYEILKDRFLLDIVMSDTLESFNFKEQQEVIVAKRGGSTLYIYQEIGVQHFVFWVIYTGKSRFRKIDIIKHTHWHPRSIIDAIEDLTLFMNDELPKSLFK